MSRSKALPAIFQGLDAGLRMFRWVVLILLAFFFASGITMVQPNNTALVLRFGKLQSTEPPGLVVALPYPIDQVLQVPTREEGEVTTEEVWKSLEDAEKVKKLMIDPIKEGYVLTGDQNIVQAKITVKYKIEDPVAFRLWVEDPERIITDTVLASLTQTVSSWKVNDVIRLQRLDAEPKTAAGEATGSVQENPSGTATPTPKTGSPPKGTSGDPVLDSKVTTESLARLVWNRAQKRLNSLDIGVAITALEFNEIHPPRHVISWFRQVQSEKIGMTTKKQQALGEAYQTENFAKSQKDSLIQTANAKLSELTGAAQAEFSEFEPLHAEYVKNRELVVQRLYAEALEVVFTNVGKLDFLNDDTRVIFSGSEKQQ